MSELAPTSMAAQVAARRTVSAQRLWLALRTAKKGAFYLIMIVGSLFMLLPLIWMLSTASKPLDETIKPEFVLLPSRLVLWESILGAFRRVPMATFFVNSATVASSVTIGQLGLCSLAGYSFAKYDYPGRNLLFMLVLSTMMIPFFVVVIPLFIVIHSLGWLNTYWALIVPALVSAFGIFLMRQFIMGIPSELIDAARIDGSSEFGIYWRIVLPLTRPALATLAILTFMGNWDSYVWPLLVVSKKDLMTVPLGLAYFQNEYLVYWNELMAAALIAMAPTFTMFLVFQRQFIQGVVMSGLKG